MEDNMLLKYNVNSTQMLCKLVKIMKLKLNNLGLQFAKSTKCTKCLANHSQRHHADYNFQQKKSSRLSKFKKS